MELSLPVPEVDKHGAVQIHSEVRDTVQRRLLELRPELEAAGVRHTSIFGSIARGDDVPESDIDLIVDLDPQARVKSGLRPGRHDEILSDLYSVF